MPISEALRRLAMFERAEELAQAGSWTWRPATDDVLWSSNLFRLLGLEPHTTTPSVEAVLQLTHPDDRPRVARQLESAAREGQLPPLELRVVRPDGTVRHLRATGGAVGRAHARPRELIGSVQDVTDQRLAERELSAHLAVSEVLRAWNSFDEDGERLLRSLADALGFAAGTLWLPRADRLVPCSHWASASVPGQEFKNATLALRLPRGVGLPGRAWQRKEPVAVRNVLHDEGFLRQQAAASAGLTGAVALPVLAGDAVVAVIDLQSLEAIDASDRLMRSLTAIGYAAGGFLAHRRGQLGLRPLTPREAEVLGLAAGGLTGQEIAELLVISRATVRKHFENIYAKLGVSNRASAVAHALREGLIEWPS